MKDHSNTFFGYLRLSMTLIGFLIGAIASGGFYLFLILTQSIHFPEYWYLPVIVTAGMTAWGWFDGESMLEVIKSIFTEHSHNDDYFFNSDFND